MIINVVFDPSTNGAPAGFFTAVNAAVEYWERELSNPINITINFGYNEVNGTTIGSSALGESVANGFVNLSYAHVRSALMGAATSANDQTAVNHLGVADPTNGGAFFVSVAQSDVLNIQQSSEDAGWAGLSSAFNFTFDPTNRSAPNLYDAVGVMEHEISEVLGRIADSGQVSGGVAQYDILDLFRYASAGHLQLTPGAASFSIDGTNLSLPFNDPASGNDAGDWATSVHGDSFGEGVAGTASLVSPTDLVVMDVLGYKLAPDPFAHRDYNGDGQSGFMIQNTAGAVFAGEFSNGQMNFSHVTGLGSEWSFVGNGDFIGAGHDQSLIENTSGAVVVSDPIGGSAHFTQVAALGPEWKFVGSGDYLGLQDGQQFLIENTAGAVVIGNAESQTAVYTAVTGLGPEWKFVGSGDYLGDGRDQFLIENTAGAVVIGEFAHGSTTFTQATGLGPEWKFVGSGDFLGKGHDQFLIENTAGAVFVGDDVSGHVTFTQLTGLGAEWKFVGTGDYLAEGHDQFLIENSAGAVVVGDWFNNTMHFTTITGLGPEWSFHG